MERGQIFSLDFLISMIVITAAIGLLIQATEYNTYNMKEERAYNEMRNVARIAANLIVSSNETTCEDEIGGHLMNCVDTINGNFVPITNFLDASGYEYNIETETTVPKLDLDSGVAYNGKDFVEVKRTTFVNNVSGNSETLTVKVWKA